MLRLLAIMVAASSVVASPPEETAGPRHIYTYRQAEKARRVAREECKPLVVHFVPESETGNRQLQSFYAQAGGVTPEQLAGVVIVVVPTRRFTGFARQLGIGGPGGYRTISPYDLSPLDEKSTPTCRSGFV